MKTKDIIKACKKNQRRSKRFTLCNVWVTPYLAGVLLSNWIRNRPRNNARVKRYKAELLSGQWSQFAHGIVIGEDGRGLDGWNRLTAIVETGIAAMLDITFNEPVENFRYFNSKGSTRDGKDVLAIAYHNKKWAKEPGGAARYHELLKAMILIVHHKNSVTDIAPFLPAYEKSLDFSYKHCSPDVRPTARYDLPVVAAALGIVHACDPSLAESVLGPLSTGLGFEGRSDPLQTLRERRLMNSDLPTVGWARRALAMEVLCAVYCKHKGKPLRLTPHLQKDRLTPEQKEAWKFFGRILGEKGLRPKQKDLDEAESTPVARGAEVINRLATSRP